MSDNCRDFEELGQLLAELCDGQLTRQQAARLEQLASGSADGRRLFLQYLQLHGELYWEQAAGASPYPLARLEQLSSAEAAALAHTDGAWFHSAPHTQTAPPEPAPSSLRPPRRPSRHKWSVAWGSFVLVGSLLVAVALLLAGRLGNRDHGRDPAPAVVARVIHTIDADWAQPAEQPTDGSPLFAGQKLQLRSGLAEILNTAGVCLVLEGPARLELESTDRVQLYAGRLAARVPSPAAGFAVSTPLAKIVDRGTQFGVVAQDGGPIEVYVFAGSVEVRLESVAGDLASHSMRAGEAVLLAPAEPGRLPQIQQIPPTRGEMLIRTLPAPGGPAVAKMRRLVASHPRLIHHYTFEGASQRERYRDRRGRLDLIEVVMSGGRGSGAVNSSVRGVDPTTNAVATFRAAESGNANGVGLQSEVEFQPPAQMTLELLLRLSPSAGRSKGEICCAVSTRESRRKCGFLITAVDGGHLTHLMDGEAPWVEADDGFAFAPGEWYYVASTFDVVNGQTKINTYVANLTRGEHDLSRVVIDRIAPGVPGSSRLGIGKGFDAELAHAYPWSGEIDEVAIYSAILDRDTLQEHLRALTGVPPGGLSP